MDLMERRRCFLHYIRFLINCHQLPLSYNILVKSRWCEARITCIGGWVWLISIEILSWPFTQSPHLCVHFGGLPKQSVYGRFDYSNYRQRPCLLSPWGTCNHRRLCLEGNCNLVRTRAYVSATLEEDQLCSSTTHRLWWGTQVSNNIFVEIWQGCFSFLERLM